MNENQTPHRINLNAMWSDAGEGSRKRLQLNELDWGTETLPLTLIRKFNQPTNLDGDSRMFLELTELPDKTVCSFNNQLLGVCDGKECEFEVTSLITAGQNYVEILVSSFQGQDMPLRSCVKLKLI